MVQGGFRTELKTQLAALAPYPSVPTANQSRAVGPEHVLTAPAPADQIYRITAAR